MVVAAERSKDRLDDAGMGDDQRMAVFLVELGHGVLSARRQHGDAFALMGPGMKEVRRPGIQLMPWQISPGLHLPPAEIHLDQPVILTDFHAASLSDEFGKLRAAAERACHDPVDARKPGQHDLGLLRKRSCEREV